MKISRKLRRFIRRTDALATQAENSHKKSKERARRDARMMDTLKSDSLPYSPAVMSWLSQKLGQRSSRITQEQVNSLLG